MLPGDPTHWGGVGGETEDGYIYISYLPTSGGLKSNGYPHLKPQLHQVAIRMPWDQEKYAVVNL